VHSIHAPNGYHTDAAFATAVVIGIYQQPCDPREPIVLHMVSHPGHHRESLAAPLCL
jgi:hypothetical protein